MTGKQPSRVTSKLSRLTCGVTELLRRCFNEGPDDPQTPEHSMRVIPLSQQRCHIPQLQRLPLLVKVFTTHSLSCDFASCTS